MTIRVALDSNVPVYAEGVNGKERKILAGIILKGFAEEKIVLPVQVLGKLLMVLTRKTR